MALWKGKRVLIIGAARQGQALARFLVRQGAKVVLNDKRTNDVMETEIVSLANLDIETVFGDHPIELLNRVDVVYVSGGVPLDLPIIAEAIRRNIPLSNDSQVFMEFVKAPVIGITGSAGKTTTTTLLGRIANAAVSTPHKVWVGGNIGLPLVEYLDEITPLDRVILEISSFQLDQMTISPHIAAILNITPNHLDRHGTMDAYTNAKARILRFQKPTDIAVLNREEAGSWALRSQVQGKLITFGMTQPQPDLDGMFVAENHVCLQANGKVHKILPLGLIELPGSHNLLNVLAAFAIAYAANISDQAMISGVCGFMGVEHRLELVRNWNGILWVNDSIATAPERTMAALKSFKEPIVLLLGGRDKNLPWDKLAKQIHSHVKHVVVFGEAASKITKAIGQPGSRDHMKSVQTEKTFENALQTAAALAKKGDVILLSPGCTSYDAFRDFEERGNFFKKWVNQLP